MSFTIERFCFSSPGNIVDARIQLPPLADCAHSAPSLDAPAPKSHWLCSPRRALLAPLRTRRFLEWPIPHARLHNWCPALGSGSVQLAVKTQQPFSARSIRFCVTCFRRSREGVVSRWQAPTLGNAPFPSSFADTSPSLPNVLTKICCSRRVHLSRRLWQGHDPPQHATKRLQGSGVTLSTDALFTFLRLLDAFG